MLDCSKLVTTTPTKANKKLTVIAMIDYLCMKLNKGIKEN